MEGLLISLFLILIILVNYVIGVIINSPKYWIFSNVTGFILLAASIVNLVLIFKGLK